ncbi:MAG: citramalate synthase [Bacillota bacterium]|nr:citramalate synthase [Bacillota bacterium]
MRTVEIYDTTLRDGAQGEGISFSVEDKIKIARRLDKLGVHYIEGGWPGSNPKDMEFFRRMAGRPPKNARLCAFGSTRRVGIRPEDDANLRALLESGVETVTVFGKSWDFHVLRALNTTLDENLAMIRESVAYLRDKGRHVLYDAEHFFDGYRANPDYALATLAAAQAAGAERIVLCDTNGGLLPSDVPAVIARVRETIHVPLGVHAHNDGGLAVANSLLAVQAGVDHVQGTVNGFGERCGNTDLCVLIPNLSLKMGLATIPRDHLVYLTDLSRYVSEIANVSPDPRQPYVGTSAFAHKGGVHVNALLKDPHTYEHMDPEAIGNKRRVLVSELSGLANLVYKYREFNLDLEQPREETRRLLQDLKELENQGFQFEGAEGSFELLVRRACNGYQKPFALESLRLIIELKEDRHISSEATIKLRVGDRTVHTAAEGNGPVNALDAALRKALESFYPEIARMHLIDYKVRVLNEKAGTEAVVRVLIETGDGQRSWGTVGVSTNIIEASWQALADSLAYGLLKAAEGGDETEE